MTFQDLDPELQEKIKNCKTREEFDQLVEETGIELSEEMLDSLSGGIACPSIYCFTLEECNDMNVTTM